MSIFWNMYVTQSIAEGQARAERGVVAAEDAQNRVSILEWKVNKLTLINMALVELLTAHAGLTEAQLLEKMQEIDLRDGKQDGNLSDTVPLVCETCGRTYSKRQNHCLYCGHVNQNGRVF